MLLSVVILNWNGKNMLQRYLPSVVSHTSGQAEVVVADNGSTDDSLQFLQQHYPQLRVIALDKNYGFAEGYNRALAQLQSDYYVLLNDDVEVTPNWWQPVIEMMQHDPTIGIAQPKLMMHSDPHTFEYAGAAGGYIDKLGYPFCRGRIFDTLEQDHAQYDDPRQIFWATGAAMFVRATVWQQLSGLDGDFFAHMEEIDFCWRARNHGHKVMYCPSSTVYHLGGGTLPKSSPFKTQLNFRNNLSMLHKNLPANQQKRVLRQRILLDWVAALKFLLGGNLGEFRAVFKAHSQYRQWRPQLEAKRAQLHPHPVDCVYPHSILLHYYLLGRKRFTDLKW